MNTEIQHAPTWRRAVAIVIDYSAAFAAIYFIEEAGRSDGATIVGLTVAGLYLLLKDAVLGKSIGKMFTGIRVVDEKTYGKATIGQIAKRNSPLFVLIALSGLTGAVGAFVFAPKIAGKVTAAVFLGGLIAIYKGSDSPDRQTVGDTWGKTRVII